MNLLIINGSPVKDGATAEIVRIIKAIASGSAKTTSVCIDDYDVGYCRGCKTCHKTARCIIQDGVSEITDKFMIADRIVIIAPSYWADIPGQLKAFIDRCTPFCNTHEPHASVGEGKRGYAIACNQWRIDINPHREKMDISHT